MRRTVAMLLTVFAVNVARATAQPPRHIELSCHRTANEDLPENTLESLEQAALLGCDVVEVDIRRTLDGKLVLNHDGFLERLTDGVGDVEETYVAWQGDTGALPDLRVIKQTHPADADLAA